MKKLILAILQISSITTFPVMFTASIQKSAPISIFKKQKKEKLNSLSPEAQAAFLYAFITNHNEPESLSFLNKYNLITGYPSPQTQRSPLHEALRKDQLYIVRSILCHPGNHIDAYDENGDTPLLWAAKYGTTIHLRLLFDHEANTRIVDSLQRIALHYISIRPECTMLTADFLKKDANTNKQDLYGRTPLHHAARSGSSEIVELMLKCSGDPFVLDMNNQTPFDIACNRNRKVIANFIKSNIDKRTDDRFETDSKEIFNFDN
ncbi:ankyrin repeat domain-containing protein [Candidatus Babeliales bacterium]|nr:ankyrin repeat domain-containing protein [Candidatus Babeliales bacterium]